MICGCHSPPFVTRRVHSYLSVRWGTIGAVRSHRYVTREDTVSRNDRWRGGLQYVPATLLAEY